MTSIFVPSTAQELIEMCKEEFSVIDGSSNCPRAAFDRMARMFAATFERRNEYAAGWGCAIEDDTLENDNQKLRDLIEEDRPAVKPPPVPFHSREWQQCLLCKGTGMVTATDIDLGSCSACKGNGGKYV